MMFFSKPSILSLKKRSGIALLMVMLMLAILSSFSLDMADRTRKSIIQSTGINERSELYWNVLSLENMSLDYLYSSISSVPEDLPPKDFIEYFYQYSNDSPLSVPIPMTEFVFKVYVDDLSNSFNINSLAESFSIWSPDPSVKQKVTAAKVINLIRFVFLLRIYEFDSYSIVSMVNNLFDHYKKTQTGYFMFNSFSEIRELKEFNMLRSLFLRNISHVIPSKLSALNLNNINVNDVRHIINYRTYIASLNFASDKFIGVSGDNENASLPEKYSLSSFLEFVNSQYLSYSELTQECIEVLPSFFKSNYTSASRASYFDGLESNCGVSKNLNGDTLFIKDKIGYIRINSQLIYRSAVHDLISYLQYHKKKFTVIYRSFNK